MYGYNAELYSNFSEAVSRSQGIIAISVLLQVSIFTGLDHLHTLEEGKDCRRGIIAFTSKKMICTCELWPTKMMHCFLPLKQWEERRGERNKTLISQFNWIEKLLSLLERWKGNAHLKLTYFLFIFSWGTYRTQSCVYWLINLII